MKRTLRHITDDELVQVVKDSLSWADFCRKLGIKPLTGSQSHLKKRCIKIEGFSWKHFLPQSGKGLNRKKTDINLYLSNEIRTSSGHLRVRLIKEGIKENKCELCGMEKWLDEDAPLESDHIDSNHFNNNLSNLQILCANCHAVVTKKRQLARRNNATDTKIIEKNQPIQIPKKERQSKIQWPSVEELEKLVWEIPSSVLANQLGVSDVAIGKRCKKFGINKPPVGYWAKNQIN